MKVYVYGDEWYPVLTIDVDGDWKREPNADVPEEVIARYKKWLKEYNCIVAEFKKLNIEWE